jgi:ATP-dependent exoDNAse (exonuclease V) alpha subunit
MVWIEQFIKRSSRGTVSFSVVRPGQKISIRRRQYALTASYAITDIKSQGQTMGETIVDLSSPPSGEISTFNAYVGYNVAFW